MAFRSISFLVLVCLGSALAAAAPIGRYGWVQRPPVPGWVISNTGVKPDFPRSDLLSFRGAIKKWTMQETDGTQALYNLISTEACPTKARASVFGWGPELLFERGFELHVSSLQPPLLTWSEGSVDKEVPSAPAPWVVISYQDSQPPVLLGFCGRSASLMVTGKAGNWTIQADGVPYKGWVRFGLPLGLRALTTTDAEALGVIATETSKDNDFWALKRIPRLLGIEVTPGETSLKTNWRFDLPGAVVPEAALMAIRGGYGLKMSDTEKTSAVLASGPVMYAKNPELALEFPAIPIPQSRAVTSGVVTAAPLPKESYAEVFVRAMRSQFASTAMEEIKQLRAYQSAFLENATVEKEPNTGQRVPLGSKGDGLVDLATAALAEAALNRSKPTVPLLKTIKWAFDWGRWNWIAPTSDQARRAASLVSIACALRESPEDKLLGALAHAGLAAERGRFSYLGVKDPPALLEPVEVFRNALYPPALAQSPAPSTLADALRSPVRLLSGPQMTAVNRANSYEIRWTARTLGNAALKFFPPSGGAPTLTSNLATATFDEQTGVWSARAVKPGPVVLSIGFPSDQFVRLAKSAQPVYVEKRR